MKCFLLIFLTCVAIFPTVSFGGWDEILRGEVSALEANHGENLGLRVHLNSGLGKCNYVFINESDSNYKTYLSLLTTAAVAKKEVVLYLTIVNPEAKFCKIGHIIVYF